MGPVGLEPTTLGLKIPRSDSETTADSNNLGGPAKAIVPMLCRGKALEFRELATPRSAKPKTKPKHAAESPGVAPGSKRRE